MKLMWGTARLYKTRGGLKVELLKYALGKVDCGPGLCCLVHHPEKGRILANYNDSGHYLGEPLLHDLDIVDYWPPIKLEWKLGEFYKTRNGGKAQLVCDKRETSEARFCLCFFHFNYNWDVEKETFISHTEDGGVVISGNENSLDIVDYWRPRTSLV